MSRQGFLLPATENNLENVDEVKNECAAQILLKCWLIFIYIHVADCLILVFCHSKIIATLEYRAQFVFIKSNQDQTQNIPAHYNELPASHHHHHHKQKQQKHHHQQNQGLRTCINLSVWVTVGKYFTGSSFLLTFINTLLTMCSRLQAKEGPQSVKGDSM